jgi:hypothetical protein
VWRISFLCCFLSFEPLKINGAEECEGTGMEQREEELRTKSSIESGRLTRRRNAAEQTKGKE